MATVLQKTKEITVTDPVAKKFILGEVLGEGSFGVVRKAQEEINGQISEKTLAIKLHKMHGRTQATVLKEERKSAETQSKLGPEYETKVYPIGEDGVISVMPKLPGKPLNKLTEELKRLTLSQRLELAMLIAQTYAEFHAQRYHWVDGKRVLREGFSHSDIKPDNILIDIQWVNGKPQFKVHIIDFADIYTRNRGASAPERLQRGKIRTDIEHAIEQETYGMVSLLAPVLGRLVYTEIKSTLEQTKKSLHKEGKKLGLTTEVGKVIDLLDAMGSDNPAIRPSDLAVVKVLNRARIACIEKEENTLFSALKKGKLWTFIKDNVKQVFSGKKAPEVSEIPQVNPENLTTLGMAVKLGQYDEAERLLQTYTAPQEKQAEVKQTDLNGRSLLHLAVLAKRGDLVKLLLDNGADVNQLDADGRSPLHCAIAIGADVQLIQSLLEKGADLTQENSYGVTPLRSAIINVCSLEVINAIFEKLEASLSESEKIDLLCVAVLSKSPQLIERFWINELSTEAFFSLLHSAVKAGDAIAKFIVKKISNFEMKNEEGHTVFHLAVLNEHKALINFLLVNTKANINAVDNQQRTPLHLAIATGQTDMAESLILSSNPNPDIPDSEGRTALHLAVLYGNAKIVGWLKRKADMNVVDKFGRTPLDYAIEYGHVDIQSILLSRRAKRSFELQSDSSVVESESQKETKDENTGRISPLLFSWYSPVIAQPISEAEKRSLSENNDTVEIAQSEIKPANTETENPVPPSVAEANVTPVLSVKESSFEEQYQAAVKALVSSRFTCLAPGTGVVYVLSDTVAPLDLPPAAPIA